MIVQFSVSGRTIILVSGEVKLIRIFTEENRLICTANAYIQQILSLPFCFYMTRIEHSLHMMLSWL